MVLYTELAMTDHVNYKETVAQCKAIQDQLNSSYDDPPVKDDKDVEPKLSKTHDDTSPNTLMFVNAVCNRIGYHISHNQ